MRGQRETVVSGQRVVLPGSLGARVARSRRRKVLEIRDRRLGDRGLWGVTKRRRLLFQRKWGLRV